MSEEFRRMVANHVITGGLPLLIAALTVSAYADVPLASFQPLSLEDALVFGATVFVSGVIIQIAWDGLMYEENDE